MNRIRTLRKTGSMSQKELADVIGVPQPLVSYWERELHQWLMHKNLLIFLKWK